MGIPAKYMPDRTVVNVIDEREELSFVKFPTGRCIWVKSNLLDFSDTDAMDFDVADPGDPYDLEYDR